MPELPTAPALLGNPFREQAALAAGKALALLDYDVVTLTGPDRLALLTAMSTQVCDQLDPTHPGVEALFLNAQGRILYAVGACDDGATTYLLADIGQGESLAEHLNSMRFMRQLEAAANPELAVVGVHAAGEQRLQETLQSLDLTAVLWHDPWPGIVEGGTSYFVGDLGEESGAVPHPGAEYRAVLAVMPQAQTPAVIAAFCDAPEYSQAGTLAWEALRIEAGRPRYATEVDERCIAPELDWLRTAVHLKRGCYPGQETIAHTVNLGKPPRRLVLLQLDGSEATLPEKGATVYDGEKSVGTLTSVARHHELGPIGLALIKRNTPAQAILTVAVADAEPVSAAQELLVSPAGKATASPKERPGAELRRRLL